MYFILRNKKKAHPKGFNEFYRALEVLRVMPKGCKVVNDKGAAMTKNKGAVYVSGGDVG